MEALGDVYTIPQEHLDFCTTIGQIARERIAPRSAEIDERAEYPWDVRRLLAEQDILGLPFPTEYGGTGTGTLMLNMAVEEIAKVDASCALILIIVGIIGLVLSIFYMLAWSPRRRVGNERVVEREPYREPPAV